MAAGKHHRPTTRAATAGQRLPMERVERATRVGHTSIFWGATSSASTARLPCKPNSSPLALLGCGIGQRTMQHLTSYRRPASLTVVSAAPQTLAARTHAMLPTWSRPRTRAQGCIRRHLTLRDHSITAESAAAKAELALRKSTLEASLTSVALHQAQQAVQQAVLNAQQVVESSSARCGTRTSSIEQLESASRIDEALRLSQIALNRAEIALNPSSDSRAQIALSQIASSRAEQVMSLRASLESSGVDAAPLPLSPLETSRLAAVRQLAFSDDDSALATPQVELSTSNSAHNLKRARNADKGGLHVAEMWI